MTDISELAQSNELLIANGNETANLLRHLANNEIDSDYFAVVSECESYGKETDAELSITEFALRAAGYVDALVEALEKAQRANAAQGDHINQQQDRIDTLEKRNAQLGGQLSRYSMSPGHADQRACESRAARDALGFGKDADDVAPIDLRERIDGMKARIAELESRTVTVENLQESAYRAGLTAGWNLGLTNNNDGFNKCLAAHAAGIKWEAE
ncbi:ead/Ea22-like family protein [Klebsiella aerogenes]